MDSAIILAGGFGTRIKELLNGMPKPMALFMNRPFIEWQIIWLRHWGIKKIYISVCYKSELFIQHFAKINLGVEINFVMEHIPLGTGGAIINSSRSIGGEDILVINGDSFCEIDLTNFYEFHCKNNSEVTMAAKINSDSDRYGVIEVANGRITSFKEKAMNDSAGCFSVGAYFIKLNLLKCQHLNEISFEKGLMPKWIAENRKIFAYYIESEFIDIGTPETFLQADNFVIKNIQKYDHN